MGRHEYRRFIYLAVGNNPAMPLDWRKQIEGRLKNLMTGFQTA